MNKQLLTCEEDWEQFRWTVHQRGFEDYSFTNLCGFGEVPPEKYPCVAVHNWESDEWHVWFVWSFVYLDDFEPITDKAAWKAFAGWLKRSECVPPFESGSYLNAHLSSFV